jgi:hypothetical protein
VVGPAGATCVHLPRSRAARRVAEQQLSDLPTGTGVIITARAPRAGGQCRIAAARAGIVLERTYFAFPSSEAPAYLVEDAPAPAHVFVRTILSVPPGSTWSLPMLAALRIVRSIGPWRLMRLFAPGRVVVGRRV